MMKPLLLASLLLAAQAHATGITPDAARSLAATCANCHGTNGRDLPGAGMAPLAGMDKAMMLRALAEYRAGTRPATIMHQITKGYTDAQLDAIAGYFAAQKKD